MKVSVIMITYGHEKYISEAINGVLNQIIDFNVELIIANDNSPDKTDQIVNQFILQSQSKISIRYVKREKNIGMISNFIDALSKATGDYIALCDGDDYWTDTKKLQKQVDFLDKNSDYNFSLGRVDMLIEESGKIKRRKEPVNTHKNDFFTIKDYLKAPFSQTSSFLFRNDKSSLPDWYRTVHAADQSILILKTGKTGKIKYHNELLSIYRVNQRSISYIASYNVYEKFLETLSHWHVHLGKEYDAIFEIIRLKYKNYIYFGNSNNKIIKMFYLLKIKFYDFKLKFI